VKKVSKIVLLISSSINGGAQVLLANLAEYLTERENLIVICPSGFLANKLREAGVKIIETEVNLLSIGSIRKKVLEWAGEDDCIVNPFLFGTSFLCALAFSKDKKCRVFSWLHNPIIRDDLSCFKQFLYKYITKLIGRYSDVIGVGSPELKRDVLFLTKKEPIYLENRVPNKVPPRESFYDGRRPLKVCFVGRMAEEKRPDLFVRAAKIALDTGASINFYMAGEGPLKESVANYINDNNLADAVQLMGYVKDIYSFLVDMDVLMITSEYENSPLAVLEAMNASLAVIAGNVVGIPHLIHNGIDGIVTKEHTVEEFARELIALYKNPQQVENLGRNSYKKSTTEFSFDRFVNTYLNAIEE
jgi:glycosyltransferase involved in cell wall biosynthesis